MKKIDWIFLIFLVSVVVGCGFGMYHSIKDTTAALEEVEASLIKAEAFRINCENAGGFIGYRPKDNVICLKRDHLQEM
jgi:hypothetical protein